MLEEYKKHAEERSSQGVPALPLNAEQVAELVELLKSPPDGEEKFILELITNRTPAGVDPAARHRESKGSGQTDPIDGQLAQYGGRKRFLRRGVERPPVHPA